MNGGTSKVNNEWGQARRIASPKQSLPRAYIIIIIVIIGQFIKDNLFNIAEVITWELKYIDGKIMKQYIYNISIQKKTKRRNNMGLNRIASKTNSTLVLKKNSLKEI